MLGLAIRIEEDLQTGLWNLTADPNQLELALLNLAANARDAMPEGGWLRLAARNATIIGSESASHGARAQPAVPPGEYVVLTVSDSGSGMDGATLARAVDPFFTTKGPGKGTGLGLSMVQGFLAQSGGALLLSSKPGVGTNLEMWLPRTTEPVNETEAGGASIFDVAPPIPRKLRVLLVDDDPLVVASTTGMLEELGHDSIHTAASGDEALAVLRQGGDFDLLLTDYMMPGMSGVQLASQAQALRPSLPILLASGFAELDGLAGAAWPRLRKPYGLGDLSAALMPFLSAGSR
jgi:CheY-like chemotaxis protein